MPKRAAVPKSLKYEEDNCHIAGTGKNPTPLARFLHFSLIVFCFVFALSAEVGGAFSLFSVGISIAHPCSVNAV